MKERGAAITDKFLIGSATVMLGPLGSPEDLTEEHSIGLVKDVTVEFTPTYTDLQQGVQNKVVYSVKTGNDVRITGASYEFTDKNLAYSAGLNGDEVETVSGTPYTASAAAAGTASNTVDLTINTPTTPVRLVAGDWIVVHSNHFSTITKVVDVTDLSSGTLTVEGDFHALVTGEAKVMKVNVHQLGKTQKMTYLSAKIVGELPNGDAFIVLVPKVKFTSGLSMAFSTGDFSSNALELTPMDLLVSENGYDEYTGELMRVALATLA